MWHQIWHHAWHDISNNICSNLWCQIKCVRLREPKRRQVNPSGSKWSTCIYMSSGENKWDWANPTETQWPQMTPNETMCKWDQADPRGTPLSPGTSHPILVCPIYVHLYIYILSNTGIYIYIYIERERERETHIHYIYIYIYIQARV